MRRYAPFKDLEWVKDKLGYWSTLYDFAFIMTASGRSTKSSALPQDAERSYRETLAYNSRYALAHFHLGRLLAATGRKPEAREE